MKKVFFLFLCLLLEEAFGESNFDILPKIDKSPRFFKAQSVTTFTDFVFSTKTIYPQCVSSVTTGVACLPGKRRKRSIAEPVEFTNKNIEGDSPKMDGSLIDLTGVSASTSELGQHREGKLGFTIWTTTRTTSTATVKFTNTSVTLSLFYLCTVGNVEFPSQFRCIAG